VLGPWNEALVKAGAPIVTERARMMSEMRKDVESAYQAVAGEEKKVSIEYASSFELGDREAGDVEKRMRKALEKSGRDEKRSRNTVIGPHRDDVEIRLAERETRFSASQGEQRTLSFCMRIAQRKYLETTTGKVPIMLLDDVLSELDSERRAGVLEVAGAGSQAIVTTTEPSGDLAGAAGKVFRVERGKVTVV
jgi:DNA replication and repair protein RecF